MFYLYTGLFVRIYSLVYKIFFSLEYLGNLNSHVCLMVVNNCISLLFKFTLREPCLGEDVSEKNLDDFNFEKLFKSLYTD